jgi:hypothetical protein
MDPLTMVLEAQLFSGTVRDNLDPFGQHEDAEIWDALRNVGLSAKTPFASRAGSRAASTLDLKSHSNGGKLDLRKQSLKKLQAEAIKPTPDDEVQDEDDEVEERVMIRSLDEQVAVGGKNFSESPAPTLLIVLGKIADPHRAGQGQRQLLALARGLLKLRDSNFLIMDESTANLDHATDMTIQNVLRTSLADTQMLVIAHRLLTVTGLDK